MKAGFSKLFISFIILSLIFSIYFTHKSYGISDNTVNKIEAEYKNVYSISAYFYQKEIMPGFIPVTFPLTPKSVSFFSINVAFPKRDNLSGF